jgi:hypothetical protein
MKRMIVGAVLVLGLISLVANVSLANIAGPSWPGISSTSYHGR